MTTQIINPHTKYNDVLKMPDTQSLVFPPTINIPISITPPILDTYPILVAEYKPVIHDEQIVEMPEIADKMRVGSIRLSAQSRTIRDYNGQCIDPWNRGMNTYQSNFKFNRSIRRQTKVESNAMTELFIWIIETSVSSFPVDLILWENVRISYKSKAIQNKFIESLNPRNIKKDIEYEL